MSHLTKIGNPNIFASLPFDQIDGVAGAYLHDDFIGAITVADYTQTGAAQESELHWWGGEIGGNDATANGLVIPGEADHPGILQLQSGTDTPAAQDGVALQLGASIETVQDTFVLDSNGVYVAGVVRLPTDTIEEVEFGFGGQTPEAANAGAADVVACVWDPGDSANVGDEFWFLQTNIGSTDTETVSALPYVDNDWVLLEISATDVSAEFRITTEDGTESTQINKTMPTVALRPLFSTSLDTGTTEVHLDIDLFHMRYLRRKSLTGNGSDWLGA